MSRRLAAVSLGLAVAAAVYLLAWPVYAGIGPNGATRATLLQVNGPRVLIPVFFPVLAALLPVIAPRQTMRVIATLLLGVFCFLSGFSIGLTYLPAALFMLLAACLPDPDGLR